MSNQREVISQNLKKLIASKGIDQRILADYLGVSEMSISYWVNGTKYPRMGNIQKMADYFGVMKSDIIEDKEHKPTFTSSQYTYYPESISAGLPVNVDGMTNADKINIPDSIMGKHSGKNDIYITKISGDSMDRVMQDGSLIAVKPISIESLKDGDMVVFSNSHEYSVKYYYRQGDKLIFKPNSKNKEHHEQHYNADENITIHGKVVLYIVEID